MAHKKDQYELQIIAWELTRRCGLACKHCRAGAEDIAYENELSTDQCMQLLDNIAGFSKPIVILTGGEPLLRSDVFEIARDGNQLGLRMVLATCGVGLDDDIAKKISDSGIKAISFSIDGANAQSHDAFRGVPGAYNHVIKAIEVAKHHNIDFQINTTITAGNLNDLHEIMDLAIRLGAKTFNPFLLVPTGRGKELADQQISAEQYERTLYWLAGQRNRSGVQLRVTCAPHYQRIIRQQSGIAQFHHPLSGGCLGGKHFAFISHTGQVQICGFLDEPAGDLRHCDYDFESIWNTSNLFQQVRDVDHYKGKCGYCEYRRLCGGCRARAFAMTGNYLESEPFCLYQPKPAGGQRNE